MKNARSVVENLLVKGKLEAAIEAGMLLCKAYEDEENGQLVAQHSARFHALMQDFHAGTINQDDYRPELARINRSMLDWTKDIPANWTDEPLIRANFTAEQYELQPNVQQGNNRVKSRIIPVILAVLIVLGIVFTVQNKFFSNERDKSPDIASSPKTEPAQSKPAPQTPPSLPQERNNQAVDQKFRSFGNAKFADGMELGYMGERFAYRNLRTKAVICCFQNAEEFSGGKARVSTNGSQFYYIDKNGKILD